MIKIIALAFTLLGIALLAQSLRPAYIIYKRELSWGWLCLIILISFFILGYGIMMIAVYYKVVASIFDLVVATILLNHQERASHHCKRPQRLQCSWAPLLA